MTVGGPTTDDVTLDEVVDPDSIGWAPERPPWWRASEVALGVSAATFYWLTAAPSLVWADGGRLQTEAITGRSIYLSFPEFDPGTADGWPFDRLGVAAWDHPLWVAIAHSVTLLPGGDDAYRLNLLSAAAAVAALIVLFRLMELVVGPRSAALVGAGALAVSHTFWFHAVTAEVYSLHALFMGVLLLLAVRFRQSRRPQLLVWFSLTAGLGMANHVMLGLTAVPLAAFLVFELRDTDAARLPGWVPASRRRLGLMLAVAFVVGLTPWWVQFLRMARLVGFRSTAQTALGFPWLSGRFPGPLGFGTLANALEYLLLLTYQFTPVGLVLGAVGVFELRRRSPTTARWLLVLFVLHAGFSANYDVPDRFTFHITSYVIFSVFIAVGASRAFEAAGRAGPSVVARFGTALAPAAAVGVAFGVLVTPIAMYSVTPGLARAVGLDDAIPDIGRGARDGLGYFLDPNQRGDDSAARFGRGALGALDADAVVIAAWPDDQETYVVLRHFQLVEDLRPDVHLDLALFAAGSTVEERVANIVAEQGPCRPIYLASLDTDLYPLTWLDERYDVVPDGRLYLLRPVHAPGDGDPACPPLPGPPLSAAELVKRATHA